MAKPEGLNKYLRFKPEVVTIFEDLERYEKFCRDFGYPYDEKHLYNERTPYGEFMKMVRGREPWDQWRTPKRERTEFRPRNTNWKPRD